MNRKKARRATNALPMGVLFQAFRVRRCARHQQSSLEQQLSRCFLGPILYCEPSGEKSLASAAGLPVSPHLMRAVIQSSWRYFSKFWTLEASGQTQRAIQAVHKLLVTRNLGEIQRSEICVG